MKIMLYFQVHQPHRLSDYKIFDIGQNKPYFDCSLNSSIARSVSQRCYVPAGKILLGLLDSIPSFRFSMSLSGVFIEQMKEHAEAYEIFRRIASHERVELLSETYYHSLASLYDADEFKKQVGMHTQLLQSEFNKTPSIFRNTELLHSNHIDSMVKGMGHNGIITEGCQGTIGNRSPYHTYQSLSGLPILPKASKLSDDIAFRFSNRDWAHWPLTPEKYCSWLSSIAELGETANICFDYETLGEHHDMESGILYFFESLIHMLSQDSMFEFALPSDVALNVKPRGVSDSPSITSWADNERDASAWMGNELQKTAANSVYTLKDAVLATHDSSIIDTWRKLQTSDHFYYMSTKNMLDGSVHKYFSPYESPYDAFMRYMNVLEDFRTRIAEFDNNTSPRISLKSTE
jgi:alpha-amylase